MDQHDGMDAYDDDLDVAEAAAARAEGEQISHRALMAELDLDGAEQDIRSVVRALLKFLGPTLVAALTGVRDSKLPGGWAREDGPRPSPTVERRLRLARSVFLRIREAEGDDVARAWFILGNDQLGATPLTGIREDRHDEVESAVDDLLGQTLDPIFEIPLDVLLKLMISSLDEDDDAR